MTSILNGFVRVVYRLTDYLGATAAILLIALVCLMSYNVIMRYAFNASSLGLEELSWHFYSAVFLLGIPYALKQGAHVRVDILYDRFPERTKHLVDLVGTCLFLLPLCIVVIWTGLEFTAAAYQLGTQPQGLGQFFSQLVSTGIGEKSQDPGGLLNRWIIKGVIPFCFLAMFFTAIAMFFEKLMIYRAN